MALHFRTGPDSFCVFGDAAFKIGVHFAPREEDVFYFYHNMRSGDQRERRNAQ